VKAVIAHRGAPYVALSPVGTYLFSGVIAINQKLLASYSACGGSTALASIIGTERLRVMALSSAPAKLSPLIDATATALSFGFS
jgi:hypothetical protein